MRDGHILAKANAGNAPSKRTQQLLSVIGRFFINRMCKSNTRHKHSSSTAVVHVQAEGAMANVSKFRVARAALQYCAHNVFGVFDG